MAHTTEPSSIRRSFCRAIREIDRRECGGIEREVARENYLPTGGPDRFRTEYCKSECEHVADRS